VLLRLLGCYPCMVAGGRSFVKSVVSFVVVVPSDRSQQEGALRSIAAIGDRFALFAATIAVLN
jgi:hypothetical protein